MKPICLELSLIDPAIREDHHTSAITFPGPEEEGGGSGEGGDNMRKICLEQPSYPGGNLSWLQLTGKG